MNYAKSLLLTIAVFFFISQSYAQNVGIGESNPQQKLHIDGDDAGIQTIRVEDMAVTAAGTNDAELATTNSTAGKAVYADANGDLAVRYVYGDNVQSTVMSGASQNITSGTLVDINGASITFTPRHSVVYLSFSISGYNPLTASDNSSWFVVGVDNGGSNVGNFLSLTAENDDVTGSSGAATITAAHFPLTVTPGVPVTIKLQGRNGGVSSTEGFTIDKANYTSYMTIWD